MLAGYDRYVLGFMPDVAYVIPGHFTGTTRGKRRRHERRRSTLHDFDLLWRLQGEENLHLNSFSDEDQNLHNVFQFLENTLDLICQTGQVASEYARDLTSSIE